VGASRLWHNPGSLLPLISVTSGSWPLRRRRRSCRPRESQSAGRLPSRSG